MKLIYTFLFIFLFQMGFSQDNYKKYFTDQSMRVDFIFGGNAKSEKLYLEQIKKEPYWGGTKTNLIDRFDYGEYKFEVLDSETDQLIYSRGFCTLFEEWQTTTEAQQVDRSYYQTITFPYPKNLVKLKIYSRKWEGDFTQVFEMKINPNDYFINPEIKNFSTKKLVDNGDPANHVDIAFLAEGYTQTELGKFEADVKKMVNYLFSQEPFKSNANKINIWIVNSVSEESGTDLPGKGIYRKTIMNSSFYTFDSDRYLTTSDVKSVRDLAGIVPYDEICILVNTNIYGGGGVYNHYAIFSADHSLSDKVFIHEFGHSFAGLGDEYYNSSTSYNDFYNTAIEPWSPNLTTMVNFDIKWKSMIDTKTPVPTPRTIENKNIIGVFEGGGYVSKGVFSPVMDCRMKSNEAGGFCPVCAKAIEEMIKFKSE
jgi:hypothetical protein